MADKKYGPARAADLVHFAKTFVLKNGVADSQYLVDHQHFRLKVCRDRERQPHVHPTRIMFDGCVEKFFDLRKCDDLVKFTVDLRTVHAEDSSVQINILTAGQLTVKTRSDLEQA